MRTETIGELQAIARLGSFSAAAKELHIARSALAQHVDALEAELGFRIFDREPRPVATVAGAAFIEGAARGLGVIEETVARYRAVAAPQAGRADAPVRISCQAATPSMQAKLQGCTSAPLRFVHVDYPSPFFHAIEQDIADLLFQDDYRDSPELSREAAELGVSCVDAGLHPLRVVMSAAGQLAAKARDGGLYRHDLDGAELIVFQPIGYERAVEQYRRVIGEDVPLRCRFLPMSEVSGWFSLDIGESIAVVYSPEVDEYLASRPDLATVSKLDGRPLYMRGVVAYREAGLPAGARRFLEDFSKLAAKGDWYSG